MDKYNIISDSNSNNNNIISDSNSNSSNNNNNNKISNSTFNNNNIIFDSNSNNKIISDSNSNNRISNSLNIKTDNAINDSINNNEEIEWFSIDFILIFISRILRLFSYGMIPVILYLFLDKIGLSPVETGILFTCILIGDLMMTFILTTTADRFGRRKTLLYGAILKAFAGFGFAYIRNFWLLAFIGMVGVISPTGGEIGPFLAVEQACLTQLVGKDMQHKFPVLFGWYNMAGYLSQALGGLFSGFIVQTMQETYGYDDLFSYQVILILFGAIGLLKGVMTFVLSDNVESIAKATTSTSWFAKFGLHNPNSISVVIKLSFLFIVDSFAGGFIMQSLIVFWFYTKYGTSESYLGIILLVSNILAGISALAATPLVGKIGPLKTMVATHLPSNIFLLFIPFMPTQISAVVMLFLRFSISQMDVPARQAYVAMVVEENERSAAGGITNIVRSIGLAASPALAGSLISAPVDSFAFGSPWLIAGGLKIIYDIAVWILFSLSNEKNPETTAPTENTALLSK